MQKIKKFKVHVLVAVVATMFGAGISYLTLGALASPAAAADMADSKMPNRHCMLRPSLCGYPDETNTGVPADQTLTPSGPVTVKKAGAVISNLDIKGSIKVYAPNVTIKNVRVDNTGPDGNKVAAIRLFDGASVTIEDSEIDAGDAALAIGYRDFTLRRVEIKGGSDSLRTDGNVGVYDSYIHSLNRQPGSHSDIMQSLSGDGITVRHNTLMAFKPEPGSCGVEGDPMNAVYQIGNLNGDLSNVLIEDNLVNGGNYTFNANWAKVTTGEFKVSNIRIQNNLFGRDFRYGPQVRMTDYGLQFQGNKYFDDLSPIAGN